MKAFLVSTLLVALQASTNAIDTNANVLGYADSANNQNASSSPPATNGYVQADPSEPGYDQLPYCDEETNCPDIAYGVVLYEEPEQAGLHHWVDGKNGECRGLSGTNIASTKVLTKPGGDPYFSVANKQFAQGVTVIAYSEFDCQGVELGSFVGNAPDSSGAVNAKSVKIVCNGQGSSDNTPVNLGSNIAILLTDSANERHWTDGHAGECRGLNATALSSIQYVQTAGSDAPLANPEKYTITMYAGEGCSQKISDVVGNGNNLNASPKSIMFKLSDKSIPDMSGSFSTAAGAASSGNGNVSAQSTSSGNLLQPSFILAGMSAFLF